MDVKIEDSWKQRLAEEFEKEYFTGLVQFVRKEYSTHTVYPAGKTIFPLIVLRW